MHKYQLHIIARKDIFCKSGIDNFPLYFLVLLHGLFKNLTGGRSAGVLACWRESVFAHDSLKNFLKPIEKITEIVYNINENF